MKSGHYTRNIAAALEENHDELVALVAEKMRDDPAARVVGRLPGYDAVVHQVSEATLRVLIEMLDDPADGRADLGPAAQQPRADQDRGPGAASTRRWMPHATAARPVADGGTPTPTRA